MVEKKRVLGCIADDFTGASDAASFLQQAGAETILLNGIPEHSFNMREYDAVIIALKTRTEPAAWAVEESMKAIKWLEANGATNYYVKYCSTFDSKKDGNIGPVMDAVLEYFNQPYTLLCPALPVNGRIVRAGQLYVNGVPLHLSPMKDHPLTPMWDSRIRVLMEAQSRYPCVELHREQLTCGSREEITKPLAEKRCYFIPDYQTEEDAKNIIRLFGDLKVLSGGSGILRYIMKQEEKGLVLAGSCSRATLEQIERYKQAGHPSYKIDPIQLLDKRQSIADIISFIEAHPEDYVLIYSSDTAERVKDIQRHGKEQIAGLLEETISEVARRAAAEGWRHIIVAGGETSGAVTKKLGYHRFRIGKSAAPGVPVMIPLEDNRMRLVLKSGNFGGPDFFEQAIRIVKGES